MALTSNIDGGLRGGCGRPCVRASGCSSCYLMNALPAAGPTVNLHQPLVTSTRPFYVLSSSVCVSVFRLLPIFSDLYRVGPHTCIYTMVGIVLLVWK